jgi:pimeloyl-ACP methyl ester carboxylesterase
MEGLMKLNPKYNGRYVESGGGVRPFVEDNGDPANPTILWIHGYCASRLSWDNQFENERLVSKFHMVRLVQHIRDLYSNIMIILLHDNWSDHTGATRAA